MYTNKNKAFSFVEIIVAISIALIISFISLSYFLTINKSFVNLMNLHKREKEIITCRELIDSYINWNETKDFKILNNISRTNKPKISISNFSKNSEAEGNFLAIRIRSFSENKFYNYYRCFLFEKNKLRMGYFNDSNLYKLHRIFDETIILEDCRGKFIFVNNNLKLEIQDLKRGKIYEEILF